MEKMDKAMEKICCIKEEAACDLERAVKLGLEHFKTEDLEKLSDIIKDMTESEMNIFKAKYYRNITEAMEEKNEEADPYKMGYNHNHYANGRFASSGHGRRMGYNEMPMRDEEFDEAYMSMSPMMGYTPQIHMMQPGTMNDQYGRAYHEYNNAKRHYHETGSKDDMDKMNTHAENHLKNFIESTKEIYTSATPEMRMKFKSDLTKMMGELT